jgi:membrane fusion protein (multidrug efflux system)
VKISLKSILVVFFVVSVFNFIFLCVYTSKANAKAKQPAINHLLPVDVYKVEKPAAMPVDLIYPARLKSRQKVTIVARVSGTLLEKYYTEGQFIKKGDMLYTIEPNIYKAAFDAAKANLESAQAMLNKTKRDWERLKALYKANAASQQERDAALSAYEIAKADVERAKANLESAKINLDYTSVKATIDGIAGLKAADVGSFVANGTPLVTITKTNPIYAEFSIPDIDAIKEKYKIKNGQWSKPRYGKIKAYIQINGKQYEKEGIVDFIDANIDQETSTLKARAVFDNPDNMLIPGEFVRIKLKGLVRNNAILIPQKAVLQNPLGTIVFVANGGKIGVRPVKLGETSGEYYIIEWGLHQGDLVVVDNFFKIKPGMPVKIDKTVNQKEQ